MTHPLILISLLTLQISTAIAQLVTDGATTFINGTITNLSGDLVIGTNGSFTTLVITNAGSVTNSGNGVIGQNVTSKTNRVIVTGANSAWSIGGNLNLGSSSSYNQLIVTNGGRLENSTGNIGGNNGSMGNIAVIAGANSAWTNRSSVNIGSSDGFNRLFVTNGGTLNTTFIALGNNFGGSNQMTVASGGKIVSGGGRLGFNALASGNMVVLTDAGSKWESSSGIELGTSSSFNALFVTNDAKIVSSGAYVGANVSQSGSGDSNVVVITGAGSAWTNRANSAIGNFGSFNQLVITNGGLLENQAFNASLNLGYQSSSSSNLVIVTGTSSLLSHSGAGGLFPTIYVGFSGSFNQLQARNGGAIETDASVYLSFGPASSNNSLIVNGGRVIATNTTGSAVIDVRRGLVLLDSGLLQTDSLLLTNGSQSQFAFISGTLQTRNTSVANGGTFIVGNAASASMLRLLGNGTHSFSEGLDIGNNGTLSGNGTINGLLRILSGGTLAVGSSGVMPAFGKITLANTPLFQGIVSMKISKSGATLTNDHIQVNAPLVYGNWLIVTNIGPGDLIAGDRFQLFSSTSTISGSLSAIYLPPLPSGLVWTNKLLVDGSIEVVAWNGPKLYANASDPDLALELTDGFPGWSFDVLTATNIAATNWTLFASDYFDWFGVARINLGSVQPIPARFFRVQTHAP